MATKPESFLNIFSVVLSCENDSQCETALNMIYQFEKIHGGEREWAEYLRRMVGERLSFIHSREECLCG